MDKSWMKKPRWTNDYEEGLSQFLKFAFTNSAKDNMILCPCKKCVNCCWLTEDLIREHLIREGFMQHYNEWFRYGEGKYASKSNVRIEEPVEHEQCDDIDALLRDGLGFNQSDGVEDEHVYGHDCGEDAENFYKLAADAGQDLYTGCSMSKLQFIIKLLHVKFLGGWSNTSFDQLLVLFKEAFPKDVNLPGYFHAAKKIVKGQGLGYINIDACINDCMLYRKEYANAQFCPTCNTSRWKLERVGVDGKRVHKVPMKILRYFPLKKRLQRYYMSRKIAPQMRWHAEGRTKDGLLRHPADSPAWKHLDYKFPEIATDSRNVRLGLATNGFNPFGNMSVSYSIWPVVLIPYNLPPWLCMKQHNLYYLHLFPDQHNLGII